MGNHIKILVTIRLMAVLMFLVSCSPATANENGKKDATEDFSKLAQLEVEKRVVVDGKIYDLDMSGERPPYNGQMSELSIPGEKNIHEVYAPILDQDGEKASWRIEEAEGIILQSMDYCSIPKEFCDDEKDGGVRLDVQHFLFTTKEKQVVFKFVEKKERSQHFVSCKARHTLKLYFDR